MGEKPKTRIVEITIITITGKGTIMAQQLMWHSPLCNNPEGNLPTTLAAATILIISQDHRHWPPFLRGIPLFPVSIPWMMGTIHKHLSKQDAVFYTSFPNNLAFIFATCRWQSPPSPPPRMNSRMHSSKSNLTTRARKL